MSRTPARFTQPDIARSIRAAKAAGAGVVELLPCGTIRISLAPGANEEKPQAEVDRGGEIVL
jgi:hypothetical protein